MDEDIIGLTLDEILYSFDTIYRMHLSQLTLRQKELLFAIAEEDVVDKITSAEFIRKHSLSSASAVQTSLRSLLKDGIVAKGDNGYRIEDRFLHLWLKTKY